MISKQDIQEILSLAVAAPSGDNAQPWRFEVNKNEVRVINVPEKDNSFYNFSQLASYIAHGALIENIKISAAARNYSCSVTFFPSAEDKAIVASILFEETGEAYKQELEKYILKRASNRRKYESTTIKKEFIDLLKHIEQEMDCGGIIVEQDRENINKIAFAVSRNEKVVLETKEMHRFLFDHVTWSKEDDSKRHGFYIKSFEFKPPQEVAFRIFRNWQLLNLFNKVGMSNFIARDNEAIFKQSAAFVALTASSNSPESYLGSGMLMQRMWLEAEKAGLSIQPTTGILFLKQKMIADGGVGISDEHKHLIDSAYSMIEKIFHAEHATITMLFRLGYASHPSGRTTRFEPLINFIE